MVCRPGVTRRYRGLDVFPFFTDRRRTRGLGLGPRSLGSVLILAFLPSCFQHPPEGSRGLSQRVDNLQTTQYSGGGTRNEEAFSLSRAVRLGAGGETKLRLAMVLLSLNRDDEAEKLVASMDDMEPTPRLRFLRRLVDAARLGNSPQALDIYQALIREDPGQREPWRRLARFESVAGRQRKLLETTTLALQRFPDDPEFLRMEGQAAYLIGDFERSMHAFARLVELERRQGQANPPHQVDLARALLYLGDYEKANAMLDAFLAAHPNHIGALFFRALGAFRQEDYRKAYRLAAFVSVGYPKWYENRLLAGAAALGCGDVASARIYLSRFPDGRPEQEMGRRLLLAAHDPMTATADPSANRESLKTLLGEVLH